MEQKSLKEVMDLSGKVAIVTGGAMGIGYGIAYRLAEAGASVVIADLNESVAQSSAEKISASGFKATAVAVNVAKQEEVKNMVDVAISTYGGVDILVNNAGIYPNIPLLKLEEKDVDNIFAVNLKGSMFAAKLSAEQMIKQGRGGKIINITSIDAVHPSMVGLATYDTSKHGLWGFTKNIALELSAHNIQVNAIAPGGIKTPGTGTAEHPNPQLEESLKPFMAKIPMHRMGESDEIGKVALFLASDMSSYMTGTQVIVDGGFLLA